MIFYVSFSFNELQNKSERKNDDELMYSECCKLARIAKILFSTYRASFQEQHVYAVSNWQHSKEGKASICSTIAIKLTPSNSESVNYSYSHFSISEMYAKSNSSVLLVAMAMAVAQMKMKMWEKFQLSAAIVSRQ